MRAAGLLIAALVLVSRMRLDRMERRSVECAGSKPAKPALARGPLAQRVDHQLHFGGLEW